MASQNKLTTEIIEIVLVVVAIGIAAIWGGDQFFARNFGGSQTIELQEGVRVKNVTWKKGSMWILTYNDPSQPPREYKFQEDSMLDILEGTVTIVEK